MIQDEVTRPAPDEFGRAWPMPTPSFELDLARAALVVVDMQEMGCRTDKGLGRAVSAIPEMADYVARRMAIAIPNQQELLGFFRRTGARVIFLTIGPHAPDGSDDTPWRRRRNDELRREQGVTYVTSSSEDHRIIAELEPGESEVVLNKATFGAFASTGLDHVLRNWGIRYPIFCGQASHACVYLTATEAADRGYESTIVEDASVGWDQELHDAFLRNFGLTFGRVASTAQTQQELEPGVR